MLTTHVGSMPYLDPVTEEPEGLRRSVDAVVQKQRAVGIDIINAKTARNQSGGVSAQHILRGDEEYLYAIAETTRKLWH